MADPVSRRGFLRGALGTGAAVAGLGFEARAESLAEGAPAPETAPSVTVTVNGKTSTLAVHPDDSALQVVRERLRLTGSKESCGHGACGACAMHVDGVPVAACLLPATALHGRAVTTIEGLGAALHPVQRGFLAEDALQCGFCTPGFVMEAVAFHDRWRAERGTEPPPREAVDEALAGHLCRCGAYPRILAAVTRACSGEFDGLDPVPPRPDALEKVTGRAVYTVDVHEPGQLEGRVLRSHHAHARVRSIDVAPALALPGVKAAYAIVQPGGLVRYAGQEVAAVAAVDRRTADAALRAIRVDWEVLPVLVGIDAALAEGAPRVYPERRPHPALHMEGPEVPLPWDGNRRGPFNGDIFARPGARGAIDKARERGEAVDAEFETQAQVHTALEPHAGVARWDGDHLTVHASTQGCSDLASDLAELHDLKPDRVRVLCRYVGGGFGAKALLSQETRIAVELARRAGAPVRVALDRAEEMMVGGYRPGVRIRLGLAEDPRGGPGAISMVTTGDGGVSVGATSGLLVRIMYWGALKHLDDFDAVSHGPPGKAFRAPSGPMALWAMEQGLDELAIRRGEDPIALRRRWDRSPIRAPLYDWAAAIPAWRDRGPADTGRYRRGVGLATGGWFYLFSPGTQVQLETTADGRLVVTTGAQDTGNGTRSVLQRVVAQAFGLRPPEVEVRVGDSDAVFGPMSAGSRTTASVGPAAADAAKRLKDELAEAVGRRRGLFRCVPTDKGVSHTGGVMPWREALAAAGPVRVVGRRRPDHESLPFPAIWGVRLGKGVPASVQVSEVEVDTRLGRVRVLRSWLGIGAGRIVVPELARTQAEGGVIQGIGYALYEERRLCPTSGRLLTAGLEDYRLPGIGDTPEVEVHFSETGFEHVRGGSAGLAELATIATAASIGNAVRHATGWRPTVLPLRPDRVRAGVGA